MRRLLLLVCILAFFGLLSLQVVQAQESEPTHVPYSGEILCMPETSYYKSPKGDCLMMGPAATIKKMRDAGIQFPILPFKYTLLDPSYFLLDYQYMKVRDDIRKNRIPVFGSQQDVDNKSAAINHIATNFSYVTYNGVYDGRYVLTTSGTWLDRGDVTPVAVPQTYRGLIFPYTPQIDFGWILLETVPRSTPGYTSPEIPGDMLYPTDIVQVFEVANVDGVEWNRIGVDRWVEGRLLNRVMINKNPPEGVENGRWIEVNLAEQTLSVYDNRRLVFATIIATGVEPLFTRPGTFQIYKMHEATLMSGSFEADRSDYYYLENVPWTMYFDKARALHGAYWRARLGFPQSHGCVNLSVGDARWVFEWADEGDWVYVWDPTGQTPTDPAYYGDGGA